MMAIFPFLLIFVIAMAVSAVKASVILHHDSVENSAETNSLTIVTIFSGSHPICNGVVLNKRWVITVAHRVENFKHLQPLKVNYGHGISHGVENVVIHPNYHQRLLINNVALVKVWPDIEFNASVQSATLPTVDTEEDELAYAIGHVKIEENGRSTEALRSYQTKIMALDLCWERLEDLDAIDVNDNVICTYGPTETNSRALSNGSALFSSDRNELIGVASLYEQGYPNVYIRIRSYLSWIASTIEQA